MKKHLVLFMQVILIVLSANFVSAAETIAILDFKSLLADEDLGVAVAEILKTELAGFGEYAIIERGMLEQILEEQALQLSGAVDTNTAVTVGKLVGASVVVTGSIVKTGDMYTINSRFIEVETGIVKVGKNIRGQGENQISNMVRQLALIITGTAMVTENPMTHTETSSVSAPEETQKKPQDENNAPASPKEEQKKPQGEKGDPPPWKPPRELVEACYDKHENDACRIEGEDKTFTATCHDIEDQLACLLSREEASDKLQQRWDKLDGNRDGFLDLFEFLGKNPGQDPQREPKPPSDKQ